MKQMKHVLLLAWLPMAAMTGGGVEVILALPSALAAVSNLL